MPIVSAQRRIMDMESESLIVVLDKFLFHGLNIRLNHGFFVCLGRCAPYLQHRKALRHHEAREETHDGQMSELAPWQEVLPLHIIQVGSLP